MGDIESEWRFIKTNRPGECTLCQTQLQIGEQVLYSWRQKLVWCVGCAAKLGQVPGKGFNDNNPKERTNHPLESTHGGNDGSTTHSTASEASRTTPPLSIPPARWELVTADDGMIVLRRR